MAKTIGVRAFHRSWGWYVVMMYEIGMNAQRGAKKKKGKKDSGNVFSSSSFHFLSYPSTPKWTFN
jgi:hypothetical protein